MNQGMSSNLMNQGMPAIMIGRDLTSNVMGHDLTFSTMGRDMSTNLMTLDRNIPMMGQTLYTNKMSQRDMVSNLRNPSLLRSDMSADLMERGVMGQDVYSNVMDNRNSMMSSNVVMGQNQMTPLNRMSQRMQIETMPSQSLNRFF